MKRMLCLLAVLCLCLAGCGAKEETRAVLPFVVNGTEIPMHAGAEAIVAALGEPKTYTEAASCAFEGLDKTYFYGSFYLTTYPGEDGDRISGLWFADDTVTTQEGITIGSSRTEAVRAYGEFQGDSLVVQGDRMRLVILLEGNGVTGVRYEAVLE